MRLQLLSDLHLETEEYEPEPAPGAELLILAGDIDSDWVALERFEHWPCPVLMVAGNHEFDSRELDTAWPALRDRCDALGIRLLEREGLVVVDEADRRIRFLGTIRWCDFDLFGPARRAKAMRAGGYFANLMRSTRSGQLLNADGIRQEGLACKAWLAEELARPAEGWDRTVVVTHFAPSLRSADPRYGGQNGTASFCNADDELIPLADLWIHGHLHCRHDYAVPRPDGGTTRVVCNARGHARCGEAEGHVPRLILEV